MLAMRAGGRFIESPLLARVFLGDELRVSPFAQLLQNAKCAFGGLEIALGALNVARRLRGRGLEADPPRRVR